MIKKTSTGSLQQRALFVPDSLNEEERSVNVVFATDSAVRMYNEEIGFFNEILSMDESHIRKERIMSGAPLLDYHQVKDGTKSQLGVIEDVRFEKHQAIAKVRYSKREDVEPVWQDVKDKILRGISVGYKVYKYQIENPGSETELPVYRAIDWEPYEISHAPVQADYKSSVRAETITHEVQILNLNNKQMEEDNGVQSQTTQTAAVSEAAVLEARSLGQKAERQRNIEIKTAVRAAKLPETFAEEHIEKGTDINSVRALVIEEMAKTVSTQNINGRAAVTVDETDNVRSGMEEALLHRADPSNKISAGNEFKSMSLLRMSEEAITRSGGNAKGLSGREIAQAALNLQRSGGMHSTSDFPIVLGNTVNRTLRREYERQAQTFKPFSTASTSKDFRPKTVAQLGDLSTGFTRVVEGGEYKYGTMSEGGETYSLLKYGEIIAITWEAIINDDLNAFNRIPKNIALKAGQLESDIVWSIITANAALADGVALFHATHNNLAGAGTAITVASLSAARAAMRKQKSLGGDFLNVTPMFLVVGPDKELEAFQFTSSMYTPTANTGINPDFNKNLKVIVEPRLTGNQWYLIADPGMIDTIEYSYLEGENGLFTEQRHGFEVDGLEIKARLVFGAKAIDYRGLYKNIGA